MDIWATFRILLMNNVSLLIGGNIGDRMANLAAARNSININCGRIISESSIYETEAWGYKEQDSFFNQAIFIETPLDADALMDTILKIELALGRKREIPLGPRIIDIDIIYYNDEIISNYLSKSSKRKNIIRNNSLQNKWSYLPEMKFERSECPYLIINEIYIYAFFGFNCPSWTLYGCT